MVNMLFNKVLGENEKKKCVLFLLKNQRNFLVNPISLCMTDSVYCTVETKQQYYPLGQLYSNKIIIIKASIYRKNRELSCMWKLFSN